MNDQASGNSSQERWTVAPNNRVPRLVGAGPAAGAQHQPWFEPASSVPSVPAGFGPPMSALAPLAAPMPGYPPQVARQNQPLRGSGSRDFLPYVPVVQNLCPDQQLRNIMTGVSPNYRGNINIPRNLPADIPPEQNCSLFITGLPHDVTTHQLLNSFTNIGRVYSSHINEPKEHNGHYTSAAKLVFFERAAAERFYSAYGAHHGSFFILGNHSYQRARVVWNRIMAGPQVGPNYDHKSRVLRLSGDPTVINPEMLTNLFKEKLYFDIDEISILDWTPACQTVQYRFGSFRSQAEGAMIYLNTIAPGLDVEYGPDPCDLWTLPSTMPGGSMEAIPPGAGQVMPQQSGHGHQGAGAVMPQQLGHHHRASGHHSQFSDGHHYQSSGF
ncbi:hypothetical protein B0H63DRAFT_557693 [Podospora didyma]|uniref:RRM domain-containing protein n=1 Tax=Podospora didyma TaxID=330526 RepID=A0AAE0NZU3_9PEZI|nr:hypothetical protein B0H63DRAFT_557693 [Podospora didyma]